MFRAVANGTRTEHANAAVLDVTREANPLPMEDYMEVSDALVYPWRDPWSPIAGPCESP